MKMRRNQRNRYVRRPAFDPQRGGAQGRINVLKHRLEILRQQKLAAAKGSDDQTKSWLDAEVAQLTATIQRAETVAAHGKS